MPLKVISIYEPIQDQLDSVEKKIRGLSNEQFPILNELLDYVFNLSGKRIRPALTLLASQLVPHDRVEKPIIMSTAVELLHVATLIHDDTVDNSDTRHGRATIGSLWGKNIAVLLGDYVFATSTTFVCDTGNPSIIRRFSETLMELSSGELYELLGSFNWRQSREDYMNRIYGKTACLFSTAALSGAILGGFEEEWVKSLESYGRNLGMAFQVVDDILDFEGTTEEVGKPVGCDLLHGVLTLPSIMLLEQFPDNNPIKALFEDHESQEHLNRALEMVHNSSAIKDSYKVAEDFADRARSALKEIPDSDSKRSMLDLCSYILERRQ